MADKFLLKKFSDIDISDPFFDPLKADYPADANNIGFERWFARKAATGTTALVFDDDEGLGAFVCLKDENEPIELVGEMLPALPRIKISTLRLAERYRGKRLGEGAIGLVLWKWQKSKTKEIYLTVFEKHDLLIAQLERFGFYLAGYNPNGERVYVKSRTELDYRDPYKSFPFINPNFQNAGYLIVDDVYHDTLFPYSELKNTLQEQVALSVANGMTKVYIGSPTSQLPYRIGEPILVYRKYNGTTGSKGHKSCITSYCVVTKVLVVKENNSCKMTVDDLLQLINNKSVFDENEIRAKYSNERTLVAVEMLYYGFFGAGNNVNWSWLSGNGYWPNSYPTTARLTPEQFKEILLEGNVDVQNVIIN
jgi:GNAT superfamily N-acetyltransferase